MRLAKLEVSGFKSFADRTVFEFDQTITGIVGPNGCGKSNIVDAMRWVMGEQSAKHLRGNQMEDVIFNGSDSRPPHNMAEVSMFLSNEGGSFPAEYADTSELQLTRRLYRDGQSEYLINSRPSRLRDIIEIFLGTGVGTKAYSIIEQGQIGTIINAKPEDRRYIIEEVAGISKYRTRKMEAERKLEATQLDLERINDIIGEVKRQMNSLNRQAKAAERFKKFSEQVRVLDQTLLRERYLNVGLNLQEAEGEFRKLEEEKSAADAEFNRKSAELEEIKIDRDEAERMVAVKQEEDYSLKSSLRELESQLEYNARTQERLQQNRRQLQEEIDALEREAEQTRMKSRQVEQSVHESQQTKSDREAWLELLREKTEEARKVHTQAGEALERLKNHQFDLERRLHEHRTGIQDTQNRIVGAKESLEVIETERARIIHEFEGKTDLKGRIEEEYQVLSDSAQRLGTDRGDMESRLAQLDAEYEKTREQYQEIGGQYADARSRHDALETLIERYEGVRDGARRMIQAKESQPEAWEGVVGILADRFRPQPEFEAALAAALGERAESIVVRNADVGLQAVQYLQANKAGRVTLIPMDGQGDRLSSDPSETGWESLADRIEVQPGFENLKERLLGGTLIAPDIETALLYAAESKLTQRVVTLDGAAIDPDGSIHGGGSPATAALRFEKQRELRELESRLETLGGQRDEFESRIIRLSEELGVERDRLSQTREEFHQQEIRRAERKKDLQTVLEDLRRYEEGLERLSHARSEEESKVSDSTENLERLHQEEAELRREMEEISVQTTEAASALNLSNHELEEARAAQTEAAIELNRTVEHISSLKSQADAVLERSAQIDHTIERRNAQLAEEEEQSATLAAQRTELGQQLTESMTAIESFQQQFTQVKNAFQEIAEKLRQTEADTKRIAQQREERSEKVHEAKLAIQQVAMQREQIVERAQEEYGVGLEDLSFEPETVADYIHMDYEARKELKEELDAKIERIGPVNLTAIEEFQELEERHGFLSTQHADLTESIESIQKAITKINRSYNEKFRLAYEGVNERFKDVFPRLFRGGEAHLDLTDPDDLQATGVDIFVRPPGKKLQRVTLLSGGEKALSAISLIFAIFLYKPSPFCLLDEVDAPLDDANIDRFNNIVKEMSNYAQFILITHNKQTMEVTDSLFGVTMEEKGVSKNVSVNFQ